MLNSSPPSQSIQCPDFPTHDTSPLAIPQPCYNLHPCPPTTPYTAPITHADTGMSMEYRDLIMDPTIKDIWLCSTANEFGRLAQGLRDKCIDPNNTIFFNPIDKIPPDKQLTYAHFISSYHPQKAEPHRTCLTVGSNLIDYPGNLSMKVADMTTFKILANRTLSTPGARWLGLDVKNYYLGTPMNYYEYMFIPINLITLEIIEFYNLHTIVHKGKVYAEICCGMYSLPQSGILTEKQLISFLGNYGYSPIQHTPVLWRHQWHPISFWVIVDDFGIKCISKEHADHLIQCLHNHYQEVDIDWEGKCRCSVHHKWNYANRTCNLSMPGHVKNALTKFQHPTPKKSQDNPYSATAKQNGMKLQLMDPIDTSASLPPYEVKCLQQIIGTFLFYGCAIDPTILLALSELSSNQTTATESAKCACH